MRKPYYNHAQLKRMLVQLMSVFSGYQVKTGTKRNGESSFRDVPIIYGDMSRTAAYIVGPQGDQANTTNYIPIMSLYMTGLRQIGSRRQAPQHFEKFNFVERMKDPEGKILTGEAGLKKTVERYMPVPYEMNVSLSIWCSNNDEGFQLIEQITSIFNPDIEIQLSNSPADWTFLTTLEFDGEVNMEKAIPSGSDMNPYYVFTLNFKTVIHISVPTKVYETKHIYHVNIPILELEENLNFEEMNSLDGMVIKVDAEEEDILLFESIGEGQTPNKI